MGAFAQFLSATLPEATGAQSSQVLPRTYDARFRASAAALAHALPISLPSRACGARSGFRAGV